MMEASFEESARVQGPQRPAGDQDSVVYCASEVPLKGHETTGSIIVMTTIVAVIISRAPAASFPPFCRWFWMILRDSFVTSQGGPEASLQTFDVIRTVIC